MLMPLHQFCDFNFNTCHTLYNGFVLIKTCKCYTLISICILSLLIIQILSILTYIKMHIFNLRSLFIKFFHMFVLPDVLSASIVCVALMAVALSFTFVSTELTKILNMISSYKSYLAFLWHHIYILNVLIYIHISEYVRTIFCNILSIFSIYEVAYGNVNSLYIKFLYNFFLTWCSICCHCIFHVSMTCTIFQCATCWGWWS